MNCPHPVSSLRSDMFNQRARGRGYGRGHGSYRGSGTYKLRNDTDLPGPTTGQERLASITTINSDVPEASYKVINTELVASYNLTDNHKVPTILVPGKLSPLAIEASCSGTNLPRGHRNVLQVPKESAQPVFLEPINVGTF